MFLNFTSHLDKNAVFTLLQDGQGHVLGLIISGNDFMLLYVPSVHCNFDPVWSTRKVLWNTQEMPFEFCRDGKISKCATLSVPASITHIP